MMKRRLMVSITVLLLLGVAGYTEFVKGDTHKYTYRFDTITNGEVSMSVTATGTVSAVTTVDVGTQVSGVVARLYADFNSVVDRGDLIAQIDSTFLAQAVNDAQAGVDKAKAELDESSRNFAREKVLLKQNLDSQLNYDAALTANESNQASLKSAEAALDQAEINLAHASIFAPIAGVVVDRNVEVGQTVAASFSSPTLFTIAADLRKMQVLATIDESDIGYISIGQTATFAVDAYPGEAFSGTISQIRLAPLSIQNVVTYTVVIDVQNDQLKLMPGMTANVKVRVAEANNVLRVKDLALRFRPPAELIDSAMVKLPGDTTGALHNASYLSREKPEEHWRNPRRELRKESPLFGYTGRKGSASPADKPSTQRENGAFGIVERYPEYEKSAYIPLHEAGRARIWVVDARKKLAPIYVRTGLTDGRYTEVTGNNLTPGEKIVMGVMNNASDSREIAKNPFSLGGPRRMMRGAFR